MQQSNSCDNLYVGQDKLQARFYNEHLANKMEQTFTNNTLSNGSVHLDNISKRLDIKSKNTRSRKETMGKQPHFAHVYDALIAQNQICV